MIFYFENEEVSDMKGISIAPVERTKKGKIRVGEIRKLAKLDLRMFKKADSFAVLSERESGTFFIFFPRE